MPVTNPPHPLIIISVSPPIDDAVEVVKDWLTSSGYTGIDVRIKINDDAVWAELKEGAMLR